MPGYGSAFTRVMTGELGECLDASFMLAARTGQCRSPQCHISKCGRCAWTVQGGCVRGLMCSCPTRPRSAPQVPNLVPWVNHAKGGVQAAIVYATALQLVVVLGCARVQPRTGEGRGGMPYIHVTGVCGQVRGGGGTGAQAAYEPCQG